MTSLTAPLSSPPSPSPSPARPFWRRFGPRRRLRATTSGRVLIGLTFAVGFAAFNTGNNLLFFGWGLLLSSIVVSGILSEATLQAVHLEPRGEGVARAGAGGSLAFLVRNRRRLPAFAVDLRAPLEPVVDVPAREVSRARAAPLAPAHAFELRVEPGTEKLVSLRFDPKRRGKLRVTTARASTAFPFGFFEKDKLVPLDPPLDIVVLPARVDVTAFAKDLLARLGEAPARRAGAGDELFSLRPFRAGDDPRKIAWRRSAKTGRVVVKETEAARSNDVLLELVVAAGTSDDDVDRAIDVCASIAEELLAAGHAVGVCAPGFASAPAPGPRQRSALLTQLALVDATLPMPPLPVRRAVVVAVVARGASAPAHAAAVIDAARLGAADALPDARDAAREGAAAVLDDALDGARSGAARGGA